MSYLGYKKITQRKYLREQKRVAEWKTKQREKRKRIREWCHVSTIAILQLIVVALLIVFYGVFAMGVMADTKKFGDGPFVMAISYTDYNNLQYVGNFPTCKDAEAYYYANCVDAPVMMCQLEDKMYMPINHDSDNKFSSFDFEVGDSQSCGFVKTQAGYSTFVEEN